MNRPLSLTLALLSTVAASHSFTPAFADEGSVLALEEIVVSAQRREQNIQTTPVSVIAFSGPQLEKANVVDLVDLNTKLPNLNVAGAGGAGTNNASFAVRGLGSGSRNSPNTENSVGLYIDDVYYGKTDGAILDVIDVERIEVLRGPQGTLFGRNSTAGAIRYITKKPTLDETFGDLAVTLGSYDRLDLKGYLNTAISDNVALGLSIASLNRNGYVDNVITGADLGDQNTEAIRGNLYIQASDNLDVWLAVDWSRADENGPPTVATDVNLTPNGGIWGAPFAATELAENLAEFGFNQANVPTGNRFESYAAGEHFSKRESVGASLTIAYQLSDDVTLKSVTSYRDLNNRFGYDMDAVPAELVERIAERDIRVFTEELQVSGSTDTLNWIAGVFYLNEKVTAFQENFRMVNAATGNVGISGSQLVDPHKTESYAVFAQATYQLSDQWGITAGLRYTNDEKDQSVFTTGPGQTIDDVVLVSAASDSWDAVTGRFSIEYTASDDLFVFGSYSRGFRAGGLNDEGPTTPFSSYNPEFIDAFELGLRSDWMDQRIRLNLTAFYTDAKDLQFTVLLDQNDNATVIANAGSAEIYGLEAEVSAVLSENVLIGFNGGYLKTKYKEVPELSDELVPIQVGDSLTNAPEFSFNVYADINIPVQSGELALNVNYGYKDDYTTFPGLASEVSAFGLLGANLTYEPNKYNWSISVFGTNLTNADYENIVMDIGGTIGAALGFRMIEPGRPREWGVRFKYDF